MELFSYLCPIPIKPYTMKFNLVILANALSATKGNTVYKANEYYRCSIEEAPTLQMSLSYFINGEWFDKREYNSLFEPVVERVKRDWIDMGLLTKEGKALSKAAFTKLSDIHVYTGWNGKRIKKLVWYFRNSRDRIYGFYPTGSSKAATAIECYQWYLDIVNGIDDQLDPVWGKVCFGNCGTPLSYGRLRIS